MCVCMYLCVYVCMHVRSVCMYVYMYLRMCVRMYVRMCIYVGGLNKFRLHCNIFIYIRHIWIKLVLFSRMVSLFHHTSR